MTKFITFRPIWEYQTLSGHTCHVCISPEAQINGWLKENPTIEIISWQATPIGTTNELYITIQYKEN